MLERCTAVSPSVHSLTVSLVRWAERDGPGEPPGQPRQAGAAAGPGRLSYDLRDTASQPALSLIVATNTTGHTTWAPHLPPTVTTCQHRRDRERESHRYILTWVLLHSIQYAVWCLIYPFMY